MQVEPRSPPILNQKVFSSELAGPKNCIFVIIKKILDLPPKTFTKTISQAITICKFKCNKEIFQQKFCNKNTAIKNEIDLCVFTHKWRVVNLL